MPLPGDAQNTNRNNNDDKRMRPSRGSKDLMGGEADAVRSRSLVKRYRVEVAASAASVLSTLTTFPLDSVKTRMQTYQYSGFLDCVRLTYQTEKFRGFFRGAPALFPRRLPLPASWPQTWNSTRLTFALNLY